MVRSALLLCTTVLVLEDEHRYTISYDFVSTWKNNRFLTITATALPFFSPLMPTVFTHSVYKSYSKFGSTYLLPVLPCNILDHCIPGSDPVRIQHAHAWMKYGKTCRQQAFAGKLWLRNDLNLPH